MSSLTPLPSHCRTDRIGSAWDGPTSSVSKSFNTTGTGRVESPLIQGGQRWFSLKLITSGSVAIEDVGLVATINTREAEELPRKFDSDDETLSEIRKLGVVGALTSCFDIGTQKAIWEIDPVQGALIRNLRPSQTCHPPCSTTIRSSSTF